MESEINLIPVAIALGSFVATASIAALVNRHQIDKYGAQDLNPFDKNKTVDISPPEWTTNNPPPNFSKETSTVNMLDEGFDRDQIEAVRFQEAERLAENYNSWLLPAVKAHEGFTFPQRATNGALIGVGFWVYAEIMNLILSNAGLLSIDSFPPQHRNEAHLILGIAIVGLTILSNLRQKLPRVFREEIN